MTNKPKRYHKPNPKGCAWCRYVTMSGPYHIECTKYPEFDKIEHTGWCNEFEQQIEVSK